eukprot:PLAT8578.1.p1 GENE.PLAT8578.1~~PLAT8578.1.p1  ORF type:complete len:794 (+),score=320.54 PLAT8578.1:153-2384(+)
MHDQLAKQAAAVLACDVSADAEGGRRVGFTTAYDAALSAFVALCTSLLVEVEVDTEGCYPAAVAAALYRHLLLACFDGHAKADDDDDDDESKGSDVHHVRLQHNAMQLQALLDGVRDALHISPLLHLAQYAQLLLTAAPVQSAAAGEDAQELHATALEALAECASAAAEVSGSSDCAAAAHLLQPSASARFALLTDWTHSGLSLSALRAQAAELKAIVHALSALLQPGAVAASASSLLSSPEVTALQAAVKLSAAAAYRRLRGSPAGDEPLSIDSLLSLLLSLPELLAQRSPLRGFAAQLQATVMDDLEAATTSLVGGSSLILELFPAVLAVETALKGCGVAAVCLHPLCAAPLDDFLDCRFRDLRVFVARSIEAELAEPARSAAHGRSQPGSSAIDMTTLLQHLWAVLCDSFHDSDGGVPACCADSLAAGLLELVSFYVDAITAGLPRADDLSAAAPLRLRRRSRGALFKFGRRRRRSSDGDAAAAAAEAVAASAGAVTVSAASLRCVTVLASIAFLSDRLALLCEDIVHSTGEEAGLFKPALRLLDDCCHRLRRSCAAQLLWRDAAQLFVDVYGRPLREGVAERIISTLTPLVAELRAYLPADAFHPLMSCIASALLHRWLRLVLSENRIHVAADGSFFQSELQALRDGLTSSDAADIDSGALPLGQWAQLAEQAEQAVQMMQLESSVLLGLYAAPARGDAGAARRLCILRVLNQRPDEMARSFCERQLRRRSSSGSERTA